MAASRNQFKTATQCSTYAQESLDFVDCGVSATQRRATQRHDECQTETTSFVSYDNCGNKHRPKSGAQSTSTSSEPRNKLKERIQQLKERNKELRQTFICRECKNQPVQTLFLPCRHVLACERCSEAMDDCIECRQRILGTVRVYFS